MQKKQNIFRFLFQIHSDLVKFSLKPQLSHQIKEKNWPRKFKIKKASLLFKTGNSAAITSNLAGNNSFHRGSKDVIAEMDIVDANVKAIETNQHVQDEFFACAKKSIQK